MRRLIPLGLLAACAMGGRMVTMDAFYEVDLNTSTTQVVALLGKPYSTRNLEDGSVEYEYIERIKIGARDAEERHYFIVMKEGRVVSKRVTQSSPLPYFLDWDDSYDMQTTRNSAEKEP